MTTREALHKLEVARDFYAWNGENLEVVELAISAIEKQEREKWHPVNPDNPDSFPDSDRVVLYRSAMRTALILPDFIGT